jgi:hypothetical protein
MPRRTRRQLVGKEEAIMQYGRERQLVVLAAALRRQWTDRKGPR